MTPQDVGRLTLRLWSSQYQQYRHHEYDQKSLIMPVSFERNSS